MNLKWPKTELGELIETLKGCAFKSKDYVSEGIPIVRVSDFTEDSISEDNLVYLPKSLLDEYSAYVLQHNNVVIQTVGSWQYNPASVVGKVIKVPKNLTSSLLNQNAVKLIPNGIDEKFLFYRLKDDTFKAHVLGCAQGAANQASITLSTIKNFKFFVPPRDIQHKIAAILSAYDDLIENNLKRIKLLEEMAQITYEEWFVRLKFPGHETTPLDSVTSLPVGWRIGKLFEEVELVKDSILPSNLDCKTRYIGLEHMPRKSITLSDYGVAEDVGSLKTIVKSGDILFGKIRPYFHKVGIALTDCITSTDNIVLRPQKRLQGIILQTVFSDNFVSAAVQSSNGTKMPRANWDVLKNHPIIIPDQAITIKFAELSDSTITFISNLVTQNQLLKEARDILLPRLMTGMIDVEQLVLPEPFNTPLPLVQAPQAV